MDQSRVQVHVEGMSTWHCHQNDNRQRCDHVNMLITKEKTVRQRRVKEEGEEAARKAEVELGRRSESEKEAADQRDEGRGGETGDGDAA